MSGPTNIYDRQKGVCAAVSGRYRADITHGSMESRALKKTRSMKNEHQRIRLGPRFWVNQTFRSCPSHCWQEDSQCRADFVSILSYANAELKRPV
jgi:hypothetical protein